jgi:hypothetical protein
MIYQIQVSQILVSRKLLIQSPAPVSLSSLPRSSFSAAVELGTLAGPGGGPGATVGRPAASVAGRFTEKAVSRWWQWERILQSRSLSTEPGDSSESDRTASQRPASRRRVRVLVRAVLPIRSESLAGPRAGD